MCTTLIYNQEFPTHVDCKCSSIVAGVVGPQLLLLLLLQVLDESRYCNSPPNRLRGAAAVDILALKALGLSVLPLPVSEWQMLEGDAAKQQKYLKARLAAATTQ